MQEKDSKNFKLSIKKSKIEKKPNQVSPLPLSEPKKAPDECLFNTPQSFTLIHPNPTAAMIPPAMK